MWCDSFIFGELIISLLISFWPSMHIYLPVSILQVFGKSIYFQNLTKTFLWISLYLLHRTTLHKSHGSNYFMYFHASTILSNGAFQLETCILQIINQLDHLKSLISKYFNYILEHIMNWNELGISLTDPSYLCRVGDSNLSMTLKRTLQLPKECIYCDVMRKT